MQSTESTDLGSKSISLRLPRDLYDDIVARAERDNRTLSNYILNILANHAEHEDHAADREGLIALLAEIREDLGKRIDDLPAHVLEEITPYKGRKS